VLLEILDGLRTIVLLVIPGLVGVEGGDVRLLPALAVIDGTPSLPRVERLEEAAVRPLEQLIDRLRVRARVRL
jgi:hypothetical protein